MLVDNIRTGRLQSFLPNAELQHMAKHIHANILDACAQGYHAEVEMCIRDSLKIRAHTTDTHGYTEIVFALCYLLGYYFMPRIRDLKDQQLYRVEKNVNYGILTPLLNKTADLDIVEEQWESMIRVTQSLKTRTAPAHVIVQRLTNSFPSDRLSKAFTNLGRIIKTEYSLLYLTCLLYTSHSK